MIPGKSKETSSFYRMIRSTSTWDKESFIYTSSVVGSLGTPEASMEVLREKMRIVTSEGFLEFFKDSQGLFLERVPLDIGEVLRYKEHWYMASFVTNFFTQFVHRGERIQHFAKMYDEVPDTVTRDYYQMISKGMREFLEDNTTST
jgi:hypothetical protein